MIIKGIICSWKSFIGERVYMFTITSIFSWKVSNIVKIYFICIKLTVSLNFWKKMLLYIYQQITYKIQSSQIMFNKDSCDLGINIHKEFPWDFFPGHFIVTFQSCLPNSQSCLLNSFPLQEKLCCCPLCLYLFCYVPDSLCTTRHLRNFPVLAWAAAIMFF